VLNLPIVHRPTVHLEVARNLQVRDARLAPLANQRHGFSPEFRRLPGPLFLAFGGLASAPRH
jgi:hypothetical protein